MAANWDHHKKIYRNIVEYALAGYKKATGTELTEAEEAQLISGLNLRLVVEEFSFLFVGGYLATRPLKWAFRIGKAIARKK